MKKLYTLAFALSTLVAAAQVEKMNNGSFEGAWVDQEVVGNNLAQGPSGNYRLELSANTVVGSSATASADATDGTQSIAFVAPTSTGHIRMTVVDIPVTAGNTYTISYDFKDNTDLGRARHWASFRNASADVFFDNDEKLLMQPDYYANTGDQFQNVEFTVTAPADAISLRLSYRVFRDGDGGGEIILDNLSIVDNEALSVRDNNIAGLQVYPNPVSGGTLYLTSTANEAKDVTIYNIVGRQVATARVENGSMNVSNLTAGVYMVKVTEAGKTATRKLIVK